MEAGGFEQRFGIGGEEQILALDLLRHGWELAYVDEIVAYHFPSPVRNLATRKRTNVRNALWSAWLRRPVASAFAETWRIVQRAVKDQSCRAGLLEAVAGLSRVVAKRDPVPAAIDRQVKIAESLFRKFFE